MVLLLIWAVPGWALFEIPPPVARLAAWAWLPEMVLRVTEPLTPSPVSETPPPSAPPEQPWAGAVTLTVLSATTLSAIVRGLREAACGALGVVVAPGGVATRKITGAVPTWTPPRSAKQVPAPVFLATVLFRIVSAAPAEA